LSELVVDMAMAWLTSAMAALLKQEGQMQQ
jgi:hypothetical protein